MFKYSDTKQNPWWNVESDDKKKARLNCISHILSAIKYKDVTPKLIDLPPRKISNNYIRPPFDELSFVKEIY